MSSEGTWAMWLVDVDVQCMKIEDVLYRGKGRGVVLIEGYVQKST